MWVRWKFSHWLYITFVFFITLHLAMSSNTTETYDKEEDEDSMQEENLTHLTEFSLDTVNDGFPLNPFVWNTTANPTISMYFNYTTALINGRLLMLLGKDPVEKDLTLFSIVVDHDNNLFIADLQNAFGEQLDFYNRSVRDQITPNANCHLNPLCDDPMLPIEQKLVLGFQEGDLQLMTYNRSKDTPQYNAFELFHLHVILGKSDARPGLMSSGIFQLNGVEATEPDGNVSIIPSGGFGYPDRLSNLLQDGGVSMAEMLKKLNSEFLSLDEKSRMALTCMPHEKSLCENAELCVRPANSSFFKCVCRDGYSGQYCQFSLFPPTCTEALSTDPKRKPGTYQIDIDGSGPLRSTHAECLRDGRTIVTHNAPNRTEIRSFDDVSHKYYPITYRLFSLLQLKGLKKRSARCEQSIRYDCAVGAPLDFYNQKTWFVGDENQKLYKLGSAAPENGCQCAVKGECESGDLCNCSPSTKSSSADTGTFFDAQAGIQTLYVKMLDQSASANITIGPLECYGDAGHDPEKTWTLKSHEAHLPLGPKRGLRFFELEFRSAQKDIPSLLIGDPIPGDNKPENLTISLIGGHKIEFKYTGPKANISMTLMSQASINDLKWHRLLIEIVRQEIRFSIDNLNAFHSVADVSSLNLQLKVGNQTNGFIGCARGIRVNNALLPMKSEKYENDLVQQGCPNLCQHQKHKCEQNSRCIEHFDTATTSCECKNNLIHYGERCEKNINADSEVSFHDKSVGFLKFRNDELAANPLNTSMVFSVRTDQKRALFVYAHDQFDNFLQVHLENEYKIVLTLSNVTDILRCSIFSEDASAEFSNMRWLQVLVEQTDEWIRLHVDDAMCELPGKHVLANKKIEDYEEKLDDDILPPQSAAPAISLQPYQLLFVGGVPRVALERYPRAFDELKRRERIAYYVTNIPSILGCMRGFMLGEQLDLRAGGVRPIKSEAIQIGCIDECKSLQCANGGHCTVRWQSSRSTEGPKEAECDCSKTSYYGEDCTKDTGVSFGGQSALVFNMTEPKRFLLDESEEQSLRFAFAPRAHKLLATQHLVTIIFDDKRQFIVDLCKNGSVNVALKSPRRQFVYTFSGNFTDGFRHFFQASFVPGKPILVLVDGQMQHLDEDQQLHLADTREFWFGGNEKSDNDELQHHNYEGCVSNIDIDFHRNDAVHFKPLLYYHDPDHFYQKSLRLHPLNSLPLAAARCTRFKIHGSLPSEQRNVQFPVWEALFVAVPFNDTLDETYFDGSPIEKYEWLIFIGIGILSLLTILLIIFCCYCLCCPCACRRRNNKSTTVTKRQGGKGRDRTANGKGHNSILVDSITYMTKVDEPLLSDDPQKKKTSNRSMGDKEKTVSVASSGTYFTALEQQQQQQSNKLMTESQMTATAVDSDDETLTAYDDRPLSVISDPRSQPFSTSSKSPPFQQERSAPTLSTFLNADQLQPDHPLPSGRLSPYLPSLRSTLRRSPMASPATPQRPIPVQTPKVPSIQSLDSDESLKDL